MLLTCRRRADDTLNVCVTHVAVVRITVVSLRCRTSASGFIATRLPVFVTYYPDVPVSHCFLVDTFNSSYGRKIRPVGDRSRLTKTEALAASGDLPRIRLAAAAFNGFLPCNAMLAWHMLWPCPSVRHSVSVCYKSEFYTKLDKHRFMHTTLCENFFAKARLNFPAPVILGVISIGSPPTGRQIQVG